MIINLLFGSLCMLALDYAVREKPKLEEDMQGGPDYIVLKTLDTDAIRIIGSVLGQSIALDYFVSQVILIQDSILCEKIALCIYLTFSVNQHSCISNSLDCILYHYNLNLSIPCPRCGCVGLSL